MGSQFWCIPIVETKRYKINRGTAFVPTFVIVALVVSACKTCHVKVDDGHWKNIPLDQAAEADRCLKGGTNNAH